MGLKAREGLHVFFTFKGRGEENKKKMGDRNGEEREREGRRTGGEQ